VSNFNVNDAHKFGNYVNETAGFYGDSDLGNSMVSMHHLVWLDNVNDTAEFRLNCVSDTAQFLLSSVNDNERTYQILNLFDTRPIWYWTYLIPNLSNTQPVKFLINF
jgi:hypothetical protein